MTDAAAARRAIPVLFSTVLIDTISFGIVIPVMPELLMELTGRGLADAVLYAGWLGFAFALAQFFFAPVLGNLSDRYGRRPVILCAVLAFGLDYLIMGLANWIGWLFIARVVAGMTGASYTPAYACIADITPPEKRAQTFGLVGAAFGTGFVVGPAIGGMLGNFGPRAPFFVAGSLALINFLAGWFLLPETLPAASRRAFTWKRANPLGTLLHLRGYPVLTTLLAVTFLWQLAMQVYPSTWSFYTMLRFQWSEAAVGYSLAFVGVIMVITQGGLTRVLIPRVGGERRAAIIGLSFGALSFFGYAFATSGWMMYGWMVAWLLAGLAYPSLNALMSHEVPASSQGELQGGVACLYSLTSIVGPPLLTQTMAYFSGTAAPVYFPGAAFFAAGALALTSAVFLLRGSPAAAAARVVPAPKPVVPPGD